VDAAQKNAFGGLSFDGFLSMVCVSAFLLPFFLSFFFFHFLSGDLEFLKLIYKVIIISIWLSYPFINM
jgi:hypothetical protein